ncbi:MAG: hypothetical protein KatS3mg102_2172 [Planctomycetota bacterium]|nr:MAG: hypothetical protein KatS3mg102_2172 [Planctomycetota bacterium]
MIEDAAQAIGAWGRHGAAGAIGTCGCFSFYPTKNLGACGDAGLVTTDDDALAERVRSLRWHGTEPPRSYHHTALGLCSRMGGLEGAVLGARLVRLPARNARRREHAAWYNERLAESGLGLPAIPPGHAVHQYSVRVPGPGRRDALRAHLERSGIGTAVFYPAPLHRQPALAGRCVLAGPLVHAERAAAQVLQLPVFAELTEQERERVAEAVLGWPGLRG